MIARPICSRLGAAAPNTRAELLTSLSEIDQLGIDIGNLGYGLRLLADAIDAGEAPPLTTAELRSLGASLTVDGYRVSVVASRPTWQAVRS